MSGTITCTFPDKDFEPMEIEIPEYALDLEEHDTDVREEVFKWFAANDLIDCCNCVYEEECLGLDRRCHEIYADHFYEDMK